MVETWIRRWTREWSHGQLVIDLSYAYCGAQGSRSSLESGQTGSENRLTPVAKAPGHLTPSFDIL
jgi:hypothetical protein